MSPQTVENVTRWIGLGVNEGTGYTDKKGAETWVYRRTVRTKVRAVTVDDDYQKSISRTVSVPGR